MNNKKLTEFGSGRRPSGANLGLLLLILSLASPFRSTGSQTLSDSTLAKLSFEQKLNAQIDLDLPFRDETGKGVHLGDFFGKKPTILVLGYYECPMLCTLVLNGMIESLQDMRWSIGKEFEVINVSINPRETSALAAAKKRTYLKRYGRPGASEGWHFLTGNESSIQRLADQTGFQYAFDQPSKQYAHPSGLVILTPQGKIAAYRFGVSYSPKELLGALQAASSNQISSPIQKLILLCFHYNPITGRYGATIMLLVRILSVVTLLGLVSLVMVMARTERNRHKSQGSSDRPLTHTQREKRVEPLETNLP